MNALSTAAYWPLLQWNSARSVGASTDTTSSEQSRDREGAFFAEYEGVLMKRCT